jgi:hypothetical protein
MERSDLAGSIRGCRGLLRIEEIEGVEVVRPEEERKCNILYVVYIWYLHGVANVSKLAGKSAKNGLLKPRNHTSSANNLATMHFMLL